MDPPRSRRLSAAVALALGGLLSVPAAQAAAVVPLSSLNGGNGFRLDGVATEDQSGYAVSTAGDINGDGVDDLIVGAWRADSNGSASGSSYVVFGRRTGVFESAIALSSLDGNTGFRLDGVAADDLSGASVSAAGDINSDGFDDLVIGALDADPNGNPSGSSYVVFGRSSVFTSAMNLSSLDGFTGFRLDGVAAYDRSGIAVSGAGDINGDGIDDLLIGAHGADVNGVSSGSSYVVFGRSTNSFGSAISLATLDGSTGFRLDGVAALDFSGSAVSAAGDINGDGVDDLIIGAFGAAPNGNSSGSTYVVFGRSTGSFLSAINLSSLDGNSGFRLDGVARSDLSGATVSAAGDINGDGIDDLIIGAWGADPNGIYSGSSYVVFGRKRGGFDSVIALSSLDGSTGFRLDGATGFDNSGIAVSAAGDVNGDGTDDVMVGAKQANAGNTGSSYVLFGRNAGGFASAINLSSLDGSDGFRLDGLWGQDYSGSALSAAGDINGDGVGDLLIGAFGADESGPNSGSSYVLFGRGVGIFENGFENGSQF
jgi:hypothetical protein